ncbi:hypothetical protein J31TS4_18490 [Paenibacillus sp. J31TS4]|uniref:hypothetical protein n=1 Tax=Paenibacillus sp. J31TS4 TaxID=2807195 RepID=UPI001B1B464E|nr:hypothetical protein [Paenibacillus sp. J31TS4]GIP38569.1 hypothetical protein J31TS4_18490 [Paenibacillus sp. J31TS4]
MVLVVLLSVGLLGIVLAFCLLLFKGIRRDSLDSDSRTLWNGFSRQALRKVIDSFKR